MKCGDLPRHFRNFHIGIGAPVTFAITEFQAGVGMNDFVGINDDGELVNLGDAAAAFHPRHVGAPVGM